MKRNVVYNTRHNRKVRRVIRSRNRYSGLVALGITFALCGLATYFDPNQSDSLVQAQEAISTPIETVEEVQTTADVGTAEPLSTASAELSETQRTREIITQVWGVDAPVGIALADCESDFNQVADNPRSTAVGVFQFLEGTWKYERTLMGRSTDLDLRYDSFENVLTAYSHFKRNGLKQPWSESVRCVEQALGERYQGK